MQKRWMPHIVTSAPCPNCRKLVSSHVEYRSVTLRGTRLRVSNVLVDVCPECDATIHISRHSLAQLREAGVPK